MCSITAWSPRPGHTKGLHPRNHLPSLCTPLGGAGEGGFPAASTRAQGGRAGRAPAHSPEPRYPVGAVTVPPSPAATSPAPKGSLPSHASFENQAASPHASRLSPGRHCYDTAASAVTAREAKCNVSQAANSGVTAEGRSKAPLARRRSAGPP